MSKPLKTAVIEDEAVIAETLRMMLENLGYEVPDPALNPKEGLELIRREQPDIVLMDINLNSDIDGIQLAGEVKKLMEVPIVFITSYADGATIERAKKVSPAGYLVKPFTMQDIHAAIEIAMLQKPVPSQVAEPVQFLFVKSGTAYIKINPDEIDFIRSEGIYLEIISGTRKWVVRDSFEGLMERLARPRFVRVHKSYCINIDRIDLVEADFVKIGPVEIPLGRSKKDELFKILGIS